ncbi:MAG: sulfide/dihydroorotate dehydrogenase-like FAD/NAD-binding protein [Faecalibacterium sp.]|nr:sulfide/dihydroorotate dehydrogenase-like FAD/NAD-binding protein [Faecalibacterium sp.]
MFPIVKKRVLNETVTLMEIEAPLVARKALPGQFIIFRIDEEGERIPLTIAGYDREKGTVTIIFQKVGYTTMKLDTLNEGDALLDFVGPLGEPSHTEGVKRAAVIGGGLGVAIAYPQAKALHEAGCEVDLIVGFRNEHLIILKDELAAACTDLTIMTDDGSNGSKGFVTQALQAKLDAGKAYDEVIAIGPLPMMKAVCDLTKPKGIKTIVSMNPIMIDGTGMCGGCRVTVGGVTKFACVDGPDFDGHQVDWAEAISRSRMFRPEEQRAMEKLHKCRLTGGVR